MLSAVLALIISFILAPCAGMEISRIPRCDGGDVLKIRGDIKAGDYVKFRSQFGGERWIAGLDLDSPGGSLHEGVRIAMLARKKRLSTFVAKECDSACAFIFLLGRKRYVSGDAKIGVHSVGNEFGSEDNGTIRDTIHFARLSAKLGIPSSIIGKMVTTKPAKITILDHADLTALKAIVRNPFLGRTDEADRGCSDGRFAVSPSAREASQGAERRGGKRTSLAAPVERSRTAPQ